jgi:nucleoid-associated protein YgaU
LTEQAAPKAKIRIVNPKADKTKISLGSKVDSFEVQFNPKEYSITQSASWSPASSKAAKKAPVEFNGPQPRQMTVELFLDQTDDKPSTGPRLLRKLELLFSCCGTSDDAKGKQKPSAPLLVFSWGKLTFVGGVTSINAKYTLFDTKGDPLRATCNLTMQEIPVDPPPPQNPTSGALEAFKSRRMVAGDTLPSIAYAEYDDPTLWRALAAANGIDDPLRVKEGTRLLVPDLEVAQGRAGE